MKQSQGPKLLMDEGGIRITPKQITTPVGDIPLEDVAAVTSRMTQPLWGPVVLALLGTVNLGIAMETGAIDIFLAAGLMLGGGLLWRLKGVRHILRLDLRTGKELDVWFAKRGEPVKRAAEIVQKLLDKRAAREDGAAA